MKKFLLSVLMATALTACGEKAETPKENEKPVVKIGATLPLTGNYANVGVANQKAMQLALSEWSKKNTKYNYEIVFENDELSIKQAALIAHKFINVDKVKAILSTWGVVAPVVAEISNKSKIISMTCAGMESIAEPFYSFNHYTQNKKIAEKLVWLLKKEGIKNVVLVGSNVAAYAEKMKVMKNLLAANDINILNEALYSPEETDFKISLYDLEQNNPDAYINFVMMPGTVNFIKQFKQIVSNDRKMIGLHVLNEMPEKYLSLVEGVYSVRDSNGTKKFNNEFYKKTGVESTSCVGNHYDNIDLLIWAFENTPLRQGEVIPNTEDVVHTLHSIKEKYGAVGNLSMDEKGIIDSDAMIERVINGKLVEIENKKCHSKENSDEAISDNLNNSLS